MRSSDVVEIQASEPRELPSFLDQSRWKPRDVQQVLHDRSGTLVSLLALLMLHRAAEVGERSREQVETIGMVQEKP